MTESLIPPDENTLIKDYRMFIQMFNELIQLLYFPESPVLESMPKAFRKATKEAHRLAIGSIILRISIADPAFIPYLDVALHQPTGFASWFNLWLLKLKKEADAQSRLR